MPRDVGSEPHAVGDRPRVDAAVDLAAPVRQVVVFPACVLREKLGGAAITQDRGVKPPLPQIVERPRRRRPGLALFTGPAEVEAGGKEGTAGPLTVGVLQGEEARAEPFCRDPCAGRFRDFRRFVQDVALDLPAK